MLDEQAPVIALIVNPYFGRNLLASSPAALSAFIDQEHGIAFTVVQEKFSKELPAEHFTSRTIAAAATSTAAISDVTTISRSEHKTECELTVDFTLGFPPFEDLDQNSAKLLPLLETLRNLRQERTYETFYNDEGEVLVRLFPPD